MNYFLQISIAFLYKFFKLLIYGKDITIMKAVVALGGNAIVGKERKASIEEQFYATKSSMAGIVKMIENGWDIVITHGNGPQVGAILLQQKFAKDIIPPMPLHVCVSLSQGQIGYMIQQCLANELKKKAIKKNVATVITQIMVNKNDEAFKNPTKPIGPIYGKEEAEQMKKNYIMGKYGDGYRILVPSPEPISIVESGIIKQIIEDGGIAIAAGGGGIPVVAENGMLVGIDAVIDKDLASEKLASQINADALLILTDVEYVYLNYGRSDEEIIEEATLKEMEKYYMEGNFPAGSMGPKIKAAIRFLKNGGKEAIITSIEKAWDAVNKKAGTHIYK